MATKYDPKEIEERVEIIDGERVEFQSPSAYHIFTQGALTLYIGGPFGYDGGPWGPGGWWFFTQIDVKLDGQTFQPDACGILKSRLPHPVRPITIAPDWVCEVLSSNIKHDRIKKLALYAQAGIPYYWIIDPRPVAQIIEVWKLEGDSKKYNLLDQFSSDDLKARIPPFDLIGLNVPKLFMPGIPVEGE